MFIPDTMSQTHIKTTHSKHTTPKINDNNLNIFYLNIKSVKNKLDEIKIIMQQSKITFHVIVLIETWLTENDIGMYGLDNYTSYNSVRKTRDGAGISIYVINSLQSNINFEFSDNFNNFITIYPRKFKIKITAAYNTHTKTFLEKLEEILSSNKNGIFLGEVNINLLKNNRTQHTYKEIINSNGYQILNKINKKFATRIAIVKNKITKTIIDHITSDLYNNQHHMTINSHSFSDHESISLQIKIDNFKNNNNKIESKQITNNRKFLNDFETAVSNMDLNTITFTSYHKIMTNSIQNNTNTKITKTKYNNKLPYITNEIKSMLKNRNKLYVLYKNNLNNNIIKNQFTKLKNKITNKIRKARKEHDKQQLEKCNGDSRKIWNFLNNCIYNRQNKPKNVIPTSMISAQVEISLGRKLGPIYIPDSVPGAS